MAQQVVDRLVAWDEREAPCRTADIQLGMTARPEDLEVPEGIEVGKEALDQLSFRYGHGASKVLELAGEFPDLAEPIVPGRPDLLAEVSIAARDEQARCVADVLLRRTRLGILAAPQLRDAGSVYPVAEELGRELRWRKRRIRGEAEAWIGDSEAEGVDPALDVT
jgi:glycerol-3-phosphate dehydrogenase